MATPPPKTEFRLSTSAGFVCGALAASIAVCCIGISIMFDSDIFQVTFSNPFEVAKTRMQLQGELAKNGGIKVYNNAIDVLAKTWKNEGIRGLQRGLAPAVSIPLRSVFNCR